VAESSSARPVPKKNRDEFSEKIKNRIAKRAGWLCSYPTCRNSTVGATSDGDGEINIGTAAHICAAAPGGPRYDATMTAEERSSVRNGIWMCRDHGKAVDSKDPAFTVDRLREWKHQVEQESWQRVLRNDTVSAPLAAAVDWIAQLEMRLRAAADADLAVFRRTVKWPTSPVALSLEITDLGVVTTDALASAVPKLDDLILVAPPGMGKTTTLFQIAEGMLAKGTGTPVVVPLGDWATQGATILASILARPAFQDISEEDFRKAATRRGVVLLLDGWNELDGHAHTRARVQIGRLKAELPEMGLVISTRKQALDVPLGGIHVELMPLNDSQQMEIAMALRGDAGAKMVDQAWRTDGVRELVAIPLYLTTLLSLPMGGLFPTTKEEVLRHFVTAQEKQAAHAEALRAVARGFQQDYLEGLAVFATRTNTAISENNARRSISVTETRLVQNCQITFKSHPDAVLEVLVSNHVLMRVGETPGVSFQHQQFQEWYASHSVERRIVAEVNDPKACAALKAEVFDLPAWEEATLFAVERLARGEQHQRAACSKAILTAYDVDPMLAAEMIFRATEEVWKPIAATIQARVRRWHAPATVDRAVRFMLNSGRPEFLDLLWPLISDDNQQVSLTALRNCRRFRPSVLGKDAAKKIKELPTHPRMVLLHEIASHGGIDGLNLAADIAKDDPDAELQESVVGALAFRRADRHVAIVLKKARDATFDRVARKGLIDKVDDREVQNGLAAARKRMMADKTSPYDRLRQIIDAEKPIDSNAEITDIIKTMKIERRQDAGVHFIYEACKRYARAVAEGLLARVREGGTLFYGADDILAAAGFALESDDLYNLAMAETARNDDRAEAAASVLGPNAVGRMVDALLDASRELSATDQYDKTASDRYHDIRSRIAHAPGASLVTAVRARSAEADSETMAQLADLLSRRPEEEIQGSHIARGRPFSASDLATIRGLVQDWGSRMLRTEDAQRWHKSRVAALASHAPSVELLPLLKRLLDDNLQRYRAFREQAQAAGWKHGKAVDEARQPMMDEYQRAFLAIDSPETAELMKEYLADEHFGVLAALVLAAQWRAANEPPPDKRFAGSVDWSRVEGKREALAAAPDATSDQAETIFAAIETLIGEGATDASRMLAVGLAVVAVRLPYGQRDATIQKLLELAPRRSLAALLFSLALSGHVIDIGLVKDGLAKVQEAGKKQSWVLSDNYEVREWLRLLPFIGDPAEALAVVQSLPIEQITTDQLGEMISAFGQAPGEDAEKALQAFGDAYPKLRDHYTWRNAVFRCKTESSARQLVDMAANGKLTGGHSERWHTVRQIGALFDEHPNVRLHAYALLKDGADTSGLALLAEAVAENPDAEGLLLLLRLGAQQRRSRISRRTIESVVTKHVPVENWKSAYNVVPISTARLRRTLLAMTTDGGLADPAARCLNEIDRVRDEYGMPEGEPRHPDLASGKPWPIMTSDGDARAD
jgi:hypothetical protein